VKDEPADLTVQERAWAEHAGQHLRAVEGNLPNEVTQRLRAMRSSAVASIEHQQTRSAVTPGWWSPGVTGGVLAAALLVFVLTITPQSLPLPDLDAQELAASQDVELLEDLEFVAWMLAQEEVNESQHQG